MKKLTLLSVLIMLSQSSIANNKQDAPKESKIDGCIYADVVYQPGDKHPVQQSLVDPSTGKVTMQTVKPEVWQECKKRADTDPKDWPLFYWKVLDPKSK